MTVRTVPTGDPASVPGLVRFKAELLWALRQFMRERGFWETPMPVLHRTREGAPIDQWATASPFGGQRWYLRHCMEDHLRRVATEHHRVYELGKAIRAERPDATHACEFLVLELVARGLPFPDGLELLRDLFTGPVATAADACFGTGGMFRAVAVESWRSVLARATGIALDDPDYVRAVHDWMRAEGLPPIRPYASPADSWAILEDATSLIIEPACDRGLTVVTDFPVPLQHVCQITDGPQPTAMRLSAVLNGVELSDGGLKFAGSAEYRKIYEANAAYRADTLGLDGNELPEDFFADLDAIGEAAFTCGIGIDRISSAAAGVPIDRVLIFPRG